MSPASETPAETPAEQRRPARLAALDVVRGAAILSMLVAHGVPFLWPTGVSRGLELGLGAVNAVASPLFGLAMGAAASLVWARPGAMRQWPRRALTDTGRGVAVFVLGILLVQLDTWVAIVLHVLGLLMVIGLPVAALAAAGMGRGPAAMRLRWGLMSLALALFVVAPWVTGAIAPADERLPNGTTGGLAEVWAALVAGQSYRAVSLLPFFALGAVLAVTGILARPRRLALVSLLASAVLLPTYAVVRTSRDIALSGDPVDQLFDLTLVAVAVTMAAGVVGWSAREAVWRPLADLGAIALSVYALQLLVLRPLMEWPAWATSRSVAWLSVAILVLVPSALAVVWRRRVGPGPLEGVVALVTGKGRAT